ncbi:MAG: Glycosyl transferase family 2 [Parcubacteria group bacterium GW2011_GWB1_45_7]|nr:MAG: Glycosyl transferase family 2 [Parcubacteria group bacterium GW2011_GWB1_45_7]
MDYKKDRERVTAIVPAYNEADRIGGVLSVLTGYGFGEIIVVVDDGSTDDIAEVVSKYDVRYLNIGANGGKGRAMDVAVKEAKNDLIFFCDADVKNLTHDIIDEIVLPVINEKVEMFIGMRSRAIYALTWILVFISLLGGERALTKKLWLELPSWYKYKFRIEEGLNFYAKYYGKGLAYKVFPGLTQVIKEKKYGFWKGTKRRFSMVWDVVYAAMKAEMTEVPYDVGRKRALYARLVGGILSTAFGALVVYAAYVGPLRFILNAFGAELIEDPNAFFVHFLVRNTARISVGTLTLVGVLIVVLNFFTTLVRIEKLRELSHIRAVARRKVKA